MQTSRAIDHGRPPASLDERPSASVRPSWPLTGRYRGRNHRVSPGFSTRSTRVLQVLHVVLVFFFKTRLDGRRLT